MSTTTGASPRASQRERGRPENEQAVAVPVGHLKARRSPRLVAAGLLVACLGGLGGAMAYQQASHANQVIVVQHTVPRGEVVRQSDLAVVTIGSAPGVHTTPARDLDALIGRRALVDLPAGSLVATESVGEPRLPDGTAQLGLKLAAGRLPVEPLPAGTPVDLVAVTSDKQGVTAATQSSSLVVEARIQTAGQPSPDGSAVVLDVAVPAAQAQRIADLAARDLLVIVRRPGG